MLALLKRLAPVIEPLNAGDIEQLTLSARGSWRVQFDKGAVVELGRGSEDEVIARTEHFVRTMPRVVAQYQRPLESADLRHDQGFAVRLKGVTTTVQTPSARKR
jgi:cell division protein FtsQ